MTCCMCMVSPRAQAREDATKLRVWEKMTAAAQTGRAPNIRTITDHAPPGDMTTLSLTAGSESGRREPRRTRPKESVPDFLASKRQTFLLQLAIDTKRDEVKKLEQKAIAREEALKVKEVLLEEVRRGARVGTCRRGGV